MSIKIELLDYVYARGENLVDGNVALKVVVEVLGQRIARKRRLGMGQVGIIPLQYI